MRKTIAAAALAVALLACPQGAAVAEEFTPWFDDAGWLAGEGVESGWVGEGWEPSDGFDGSSYEGALPEAGADADGVAAGATSGEEFRELGVVEFGGVPETWYSSAAARHWRTDEWTPDEEGFYRTEEGRYVVASDLWPEGAVIETSRGTAQVLDCGCGACVDFYTAW